MKMVIPSQDTALKGFHQKGSLVNVYTKLSITFYIINQSSFPSNQQLSMSIASSLSCIDLSKFKATCWVRYGESHSLSVILLINGKYRTLFSSYSPMQIRQLSRRPSNYNIINELIVRFKRMFYCTHTSFIIKAVLANHLHKI